jgi:hypothetical protein
LAVAREILQAAAAQTLARAPAAAEQAWCRQHGVQDAL